MAPPTNHGTCTWVLTNGVWTLQDANCAAGCSCTGPLPLGFNPVTHTTDQQAFFQDPAFRNHVKAKFGIQIGANDTKATVPCVVSPGPEVEPATPLAP